MDLADPVSMPQDVATKQKFGSLLATSRDLTTLVIDLPRQGETPNIEGESYNSEVRRVILGQLFECIDQLMDLVPEEVESAVVHRLHNIQQAVKEDEPEGLVLVLVELSRLMTAGPSLPASI
ncbi:MAG: hypothetical protein ACE5KG_00105 [Nitrososphaerales archaeon]